MSPRLRSPEPIYYRQAADGTFYRAKPRKRPPDKGDRKAWKHQAEQVRGVLISRLDQLGAEKILPQLERHGITWDQWIWILQTIQVALFPEEFDPKSRSVGLVPDRGLTTLKVEYLESLMRTLVTGELVKSPNWKKALPKPGSQMTICDVAKGKWMDLN